MKSIDVLYRSMEKGEESSVSALVEDVFAEFVMPLYSRQGAQEFQKYAQKEKILERLHRNHCIMVARVGSRVIGVIEIRDFCHISMLFVDGQYQRRGIGGNLIKKAVAICQENNPGLNQITVHSSPNAVQAYERSGFVPAGGEREVNGIRFVPMALELAIGDDA